MATGSEVSFAAVIKDREEHLKFQVADFPMYPRLAVLDPDSTRTLPPAIAAATGMDAMTHAIEGYVSAEWNAHGDARALHALRLIRDNKWPIQATIEFEYPVPQGSKRVLEIRKALQYCKDALLT